MLVSAVRTLLLCIKITCSKTFMAPSKNTTNSLATTLKQPLQPSYPSIAPLKNFMIPIYIDSSYYTAATTQQLCCGVQSTFFLFVAHHTKASLILLGMYNKTHLNFWYTDRKP